MQVTLDEGQTIADELEGESACERRFDKVVTLGLKDLFIRVNAVDHKGLRVGKVEISDERCFRKLSRPFAKELWEPGDVQELVSLTNEEGVILSH